MGLEKVKEDIISEAKQKAEEIREEKSQEKEEILEEARKEAEKIRENMEKKIEDEKNALEKRKLSNARMKAKEIKLESKQEKIDEAFEHFRQRIRNMSSSEKEEFVQKAIDKAKFEVGEVKASETFEDAVKQAGFEPEYIEEPGVIVVSENGERRQSYTIEKIAQDFRKENRKDLIEVLFS